MRISKLRNRIIDFFLYHLNRYKAKIKKNSNFELSIPHIKEYNETSKLALSHFSAYNYGNVGDTLLPINVKDSINLFDEYGINWKDFHVHKIVDEKLINQVNQTSGIIIGGGGLFLKDTNENDLSGWQWNCSIESLKKITVPIALFAVGYNRFRSQEEFAPIFFKHIELLSDKSFFIGMRNKGSIDNIKKYVPERNHHKIKLQFCPTTISSRLYPEIIYPNKKEESKIIAVNMAFDRSHFRFGEQIGEKLTAVANVLKQLYENGYEIHYYSHMCTDENFLIYLESFEIPYTLIRLKDPKDTLIKYSVPKLVIGMRGHAQMIPFGCETPILSIISHEKMRWFLQDIDREEWGVEINSENFQQNLYEVANSILINADKIENQIKTIQNKIFTETKENVRLILDKFS